LKSLHCGVHHCYYAITALAVTHRYALLETAAQIYHSYILLHKIRAGSDKYVNKKERERKCLLPMQVSRQPTHSLANGNES